MVIRQNLGPRVPGTVEVVRAETWKIEQNFWDRKTYKVILQSNKIFSIYNLSWTKALGICSHLMYMPCCLWCVCYVWWVVLCCAVWSKHCVYVWCICCLWCVHLCVVGMLCVVFVFCCVLFVVCVMWCVFMCVLHVFPVFHVLGVDVHGIETSAPLSLAALLVEALPF